MCIGSIHEAGVSEKCPLPSWFPKCRFVGEAEGKCKLSDTETHTTRVKPACHLLCVEAVKDAEVTE